VSGQMDVAQRITDDDSSRSPANTVSHTLAVLHSAHVTSTVSAAAARISTIIIKSILTSPLLQS